MLCIDKYQDKIERFNTTTNILDFVYQNLSISNKSGIIFPEKISKIIKIDQISFYNLEILKTNPFLVNSSEWAHALNIYIQYVYLKINNNFIGDLIHQTNLIDFFKNSGNMLISRNDKFTIIIYDNIFFCIMKHLYYFQQNYLINLSYLPKIKYM